MAPSAAPPQTSSPGTAAAPPVAPPPTGTFPPNGARPPTGTFPPNGAPPPTGTFPPNGTFVPDGSLQPRRSLPTTAEVIAAWKPGDDVPLGFRPVYKYNMTEIYAGGGILAGSFVITTLIASTMIATNPINVIYAPSAGFPVIGAYPVAGVGASIGAIPTGTVAMLIAFGALQDIGFGVLLHGLTTRKRVGIEEDCRPLHGDGWSLRLSPMVSPNVAGVSFGGAL
ncbi:MAG: hypothetical protein U0441_28115 [Polyangiaceae bacterium]